MTLKSLFKHNPNIIINTDIDGVLSGLLLVKYCDCNIVGFTNSRDKVWLADGHDDLYGSVYVDMFVTDPKAICIDQHVVALDKKHMQDIRKNKQIFSPQSDDENNLRVFDEWNFKNKYPFGTFQYIVAKLESEGIKIQFPDLHDLVPNSAITVGDLLNRPDDAMKTTIYAYKKNADNWWNWLNTLAPNGSIAQLKGYLDYLESLSDAKVDAIAIPKGQKKHKKTEYIEQRKKDVEVIKEHTKDYFKNNFQCEGKSGDGDLKIIADDNGYLSSNVSSYIYSIAAIIGLKNIVIPNHYNIHKGVYCRTRWLPIFSPDFLANYSIARHKIFSYAFIYGPDNDGKTNFSFTIDMQ